MKSTLIRSAAVSDPGHVRGNNEDRVYSDDERGIYAVIDGVGGQAGGERAAAIAEEELLARLARPTGAIEDRLREGIALAGKRILDHARRNPEFAGMACVLTVAVVADGEAVVGHVGDTRLYKIRRSAIEKITRDHSPVGAREDRGEISEREAMQHPRRNEIFRDVGSEEHAPYDADFVDIERIAFEADSALLLCSDGLTDQVSSAEIAEVVAQHTGDPPRIARELIRRANDAGGKDNVSVVYVEGPDVHPAATEPAAPEAPQPRRRRAALPWIAGGLAGLVLGAGATALVWRYWPAATPPGPRVLAVPSAEYASIGAALAAARSGDTVELGGGTYREQVEMKEGVRVVCAGDAALDPAADAAQPGAAVVARNLRSGSIAGLRIALAQNSGVATGILIDNSDVEISGVEVRGANSAAIAVLGTSRALLRGNRLDHNSGTGVMVAGAAAPRILSNIIADNGRAGIEVAAGARPVLQGNVFASNPRPIAWEKSPEREAEAVKQNHVVPPPRKRPRGAR